LGRHDGRSLAAISAERRSLKRAEEEQLVFFNRAAERETILILNRDRNGRQADAVELLAARQREERARRDDVIDRAMKLIRPVPANQVDDRPAAASVLRRIIRAEHRHLLKPFAQTRYVSLAADRDVIVFRAVDQLAVGARA